MTKAIGERLVVPLRENFFCDGAYYLITSSSLGGLSSGEIAERVSSGDAAAIGELLSNGACVPVAFPGDCAMDDALIVVGDLTSEEESEWIGKISAKLKIPCGKLIVTCGGGDQETLDGAVSGEGLSSFTDFFQTVEVEPGEYLVEVYAHIPSTTGNFFFESEDEPMKEWKEWFQQSRAGEKLPEWLEKPLKPYDMPGELDELVSYIIRLKPLQGESPSLPTLDPEIGWCTFDMRRPEKCPAGIPRSKLLG